ncbi:hypothetical protein B0T21DRAFT_359940 [Apiosordaria backusii]|uniref:Uncharacterized protein n=1 Tax=Apiosordaria backusii TaxID=314023 RepID=A0AA40K0Q7_9PEZI|nr:hypothetical protein B0T21DRAFT_359940 [Apiosordaria backusii]
MLLFLSFPLSFTRAFVLFFGLIHAYLWRRLWAPTQKLMSRLGAGQRWAFQGIGLIAFAATYILTHFVREAYNNWAIHPMMGENTTELMGGLIQTYDGSWGHKGQTRWGVV